MLLILAFANPFINRNAAALASNRLVLLVVDNSFSMRAGTRLADAKAAAMGVSSGEGRRARASGGVRLPIAADDASRSRIKGRCAPPCKPFSPATATAISASWRARSAPWPSPSTPHRVSSVQRHATQRTGRHVLRHGAARQRQLVTHAVVTKAQPNWTVESVDAPGQVWGKDAKPVHVQAVIAGYGTPAAQRTVSLVVNGKTTATKPVEVPANGRATVDFPALEVPYGFSRCEVKIDSADGFAADDLHRFAVERSDPQKALLVHGYNDNRSPLYIRAALSSAAQSAFTLDRWPSTMLLTASRPITRSSFCRT